ncbi:histone deacetylase family protein [Acuticoccus sediminis]|uniref:histone deacetylase family protein n=1 Tax=Acuticoccus sediminis TaxID=2184697 RepID=UPI001CFDBFEF|nr:histone deacetylase family protein [Acuticoccus sediminis]
MRTFYAAETAQHAPKTFMLRGRIAQNEERAERAERLLAGLARLDLKTEEPPAAPAGTRSAVHSIRYLEFLETAYAAWSKLPGAGEEVLPNTHPLLPGPTYPTGIVGRTGWHLGDLAVPIGPGTWPAVARAADAAVAAAEVAATGASAYALARPPGHHASREVAGGHCFLNNAAIAAEVMIARGARPAILDIDVHHGNGTQAITYDRGDILFVSIHTDPSSFYPWFWGYAHETGAGAGEGANINLPLPVGADDEAWLGAIRVALGHIARFGADSLVLSLGLDIHASDPLGGMSVTTEGIGRAGELMGRAGLPTAIIQEGGYLSEPLTDNIAAFLSGFLGASS